MKHIFRDVHRRARAKQSLFSREQPPLRCCLITTEKPVISQKRKEKRRGLYLTDMRAFVLLFFFVVVSLSFHIKQKIGKWDVRGFYRALLELELEPTGRPFCRLLWAHCRDVGFLDSRAL
jgi:hypothetical protein